MDILSIVESETLRSSLKCYFSLPYNLEIEQRLEVFSQIDLLSFNGNYVMIIFCLW